MTGVLLMQNHNNQERFTIEKPPYDSVSTLMNTALGKLHIRGPLSPEKLSSHRLSEGLCCFRPSSRQHSSLLELTKQEDGLVFTAALANIIISYVTFQKPDYPWWQERCFPRLVELGSIETDPSWRNMGISKMLLDNLFKNPDFLYFEDYIVIAVHFIQSWDLKNTGLSSWAYRDFMLSLFKQYGFTNWETVDPEVREHPCNMLLARVGNQSGLNDIAHFTSCCLGTN